MKQRFLLILGLSLIILAGVGIYFLNKNFRFPQKQPPTKRVTLVSSEGEVGLVGKNDFLVSTYEFDSCKQKEQFKITTPPDVGGSPSGRVYALLIGADGIYYFSSTYNESNQWYGNIRESIETVWRWDYAGQAFVPIYAIRPPEEGTIGILLSAKDVFGNIYFITKDGLFKVGKGSAELFIKLTDTAISTLRNSSDPVPKYLASPPFLKGGVLQFSPYDQNFVPIISEGKLRSFGSKKIFIDSVSPDGRYVRYRSNTRYYGDPNTRNSIVDLETDKTCEFLSGKVIYDEYWLPQ